MEYINKKKREKREKNKNKKEKGSKIKNRRGRVFNYENVPSSSESYVLSDLHQWEGSSRYNDESMEEIHTGGCGPLLRAKSKHPGSTGTFYFIFMKPSYPSLPPRQPTAADVKQISENLPYCSAFSGKEGLSAYLLFGTLVGWLLVAGRFCSIAKRFFLFFFFIPPISAAIPDKWRGGRDGLGGEVGRLLLNALFEPGAPASSSILTCKLAKIKRELLTRMPGISAGGGNSYSTRSLSKEAFPINVLACNVFCSTSVFFIHASTV